MSWARLSLIVMFVCSCGDPPVAPPSEEPPVDMRPTTKAPTGVHPGPVALPNERMVSSTMLDPRLLEDDPGPTDPFAHEAPLDLSIIEED